jgi:hypothetical protein
MTSVTTPPRYRGLKRVSVAGDVVKVAADGRLRFKVDLGRAHGIQQYTPGAATTMVRRTVKLEPHAVIRISRANWSSAGLRVCATALGGTVSRLVISGTRLRGSITASSRCFTVRLDRRPTRIMIEGKDRYGHPVRAGAPVR